MTRLRRWVGPSPEARAALCAGLPRWLRPGRALLVGLVLLVLGTGLLAGAGVAFADDPPTNPCTGNRGGGNICREDNPSTAQQQQHDEEEKEKRKEKAEKAKAQAEFDKLVEARKEKQIANKGVLSTFDVRDRDGSPVAVYQVQADTGDWKDWESKVANWLVQVGFQINLWLVCFACWLIAWALSFSLAALLLKPAMHVGSTLYSNVLVQMGLPTLFLTIAGTVAAWQWMFGSRARGWGEMLAALLISALGAGVLATPVPMLLSTDNGAVGQARELSVEVAQLLLSDLDPADGANGVSGGSPASGRGATPERTLSSEVSRPLTDAVVDVFAVRTSMLLSYGQVFTGKCSRDFRDVRIAQAVYEDALQEAQDKRQGRGMAWLSDQLEKVPGVGPWLAQNRRDEVDEWLSALGQDTDDEVWQGIIDEGPIKDFEKKCVKGSAKSAKKASVEKVVACLFLVLAALIVIALIVVLVCAYLNAQFWLAIEAMLAKVALAVGVLPGPGRSWLWTRATAVMKHLSLMIASIVALAIFLLILTALIEAKEEELPGGLVTRFIVLDIATIACFCWRKKIVGTITAGTRRVRTRLGNSPFGGSQPLSADAPRSRGGVGKVAAAAALLTLGGGGAVLAGRGAGRVAAGRALTRVGGGVVRGTARTSRHLAQVAATGSGIIGRAGGAGARTVGTTAGRAAARDRLGTHLGRLRDQAGVGLPDQAVGSARDLSDRMTRLRTARDARDRLASLRATRNTHRTDPGAGDARPSARRTGTPGTRTDTAGGAPRRGPGAPGARGARTASARAPRSGTPAPAPGGTRRTPPTGSAPPAGTSPGSSSSSGSLGFTPPRRRPPVVGPSSPLPPRRRRP